MKRFLAVFQMIFLAGSLSAKLGSAHAAEESPEAQLSRRVDLEWAEVAKAKEYELELGIDPEFTTPMIRKRSPETKISADLLPGAYFYRVRAIDLEGLPGSWSSAQDLNINPKPPTLLSPADQALIQGNLPDTGIELKWSSSGPGIKYVLEVKTPDETGAFVKTAVRQELEGTNFAFFPQDVGKFQWSVHTLGAGGDEPGKILLFTVEGVMQRLSQVEPGANPKRVVRYVSPWWRGHWTFFARYGQSILSYSLVDQDLRTSGTFSGLTGYVVGTLNWEWHDPVSWTFGGVPWAEAELQLDRQMVLGESVVLPRHNLRVGSWYEDWVRLWRFTPVIEYGDEEVAIYQFRSPTEAARSNSIRKHFGVGVVAEYRLKTFLAVGAGIKFKSESGGQGGLTAVNGTGTQLDLSRRAGDLEGGSAMDFMAYGTMDLSSRIKLQGRIRYEGSAGKWAPIWPIAANSPSADGKSSYSSNHLGFDVGVGIKF